MREIKFRAWLDKVVPCDWDGESWSYKSCRAMKEVKSIHFGTGKIIISDKHGNHSEHPDDYTLMQYTGLKDKNGVEIYEGDIVQIWSEHPGGGIGTTGVVKYYECQYWIENNYGAIALFREDCQCLVEGNIHQNPELLD